MIHTIPFVGSTSIRGARNSLATWSELNALLVASGLMPSVSVMNNSGGMMSRSSFCACSLFHDGLYILLCVHSSVLPSALQASHAKPTDSTWNSSRPLTLWFIKIE